MAQMYLDWQEYSWLQSFERFFVRFHQQAFSVGQCETKKKLCLKVLVAEAENE